MKDSSPAYFVSPHKTEPRRDDALWKELLSCFFVPMLHALLPDLAKDLDPGRPISFLDKELRRLARFKRQSESPDSDRSVDFLADVPLVSGQEARILLHVEVQGRGGKESFSRRMHRYRCLLEGRYDRPVAALALLVEPLSEGQSSGIYCWEAYGTEVRYKFPVIKIFEGDEEC